MNTENHPLTQFRYRVYQNFNKRADSSMDLLDALCSTPNARSVVELSLSPYFRRDYSALFKVIAVYEMTDRDLAHLAASYLPAPHRRPFWLLATDVTPQPRPYSATLAGRGFVYQPTVISGNQPITIGHEYSTVVVLPEKAARTEPAWVIPLSVRRVPLGMDKERLGDAQLQALLTDEALPFHGQLCVSVRDASYSKPACLYAERAHENLVSLTRVRSNRVFYRPYVPPAEAPAPRGHPCWYGERFALREEDTWGPPDEQTTCQMHNQRGQQYRVEIQAWHNLLMRGKQKPEVLPMHRYPFTLIRVQVYRADGTPLYRRDLWLILMGARRAEVTPRQAYQAYDQRFDHEHSYRFAKQRLLLDNYQTPDVTHEEHWWRFVHLAYLQLWVAREVAERLPRSWERYLPTMQTPALLTPTLVQRDFGRIIGEFGTPARPAKQRGYSPGRQPGTPGPVRERQPVLKKQAAAASPG